MASDLSTRYADFEDLAEVYTMYVTGLRELGDKVMPVSEDKALQHVINCWAQAPCVLLIEDGQIIGFGGLRTVLPEYSNTPVITDYMFYITPDTRSRRAANVLSAAAQKVSDEYKMPMFLSHSPKMRNVERRARAMEKLGYRIEGLSMSYGVKYGW